LRVAQKHHFFSSATRAFDVIAVSRRHLLVKANLDSLVNLTLISDLLTRIASLEDLVAALALVPRHDVEEQVALALTRKTRVLPITVAERAFALGVKLRNVLVALLALSF